MISLLEKFVIVLCVLIIVLIVLLIFDLGIGFEFFEDWSFRLTLTGCLPPGNCIY